MQIAPSFNNVETISQRNCRYFYRFPEFLSSFSRYFAIFFLKEAAEFSTLMKWMSSIFAALQGEGAHCGFASCMFTYMRIVLKCIC